MYTYTILNPVADTKRVILVFVKSCGNKNNVVISDTTTDILGNNKLSQKVLSYHDLSTDGVDRFLNRMSTLELSRAYMI